MRCAGEDVVQPGRVHERDERVKREKQAEMALVLTLELVLLRLNGDKVVSWLVRKVRRVQAALAQLELAAILEVAADDKEVTVSMLTEVLLATEMSRRRMELAARGMDFSRRIHVGLHYPTDVRVGAALGVLSSIMAIGPCFISAAG